MKCWIICLLAVLAAAQAHAINGLWVHPERVTNPEIADKTLDQAQRCGIDNIYLLVFYGEKAWFHTPHAPMAENVEEGFDPLGYCIEQGHKRGMKVHAWFVNGEGAGGPILSKHPDWQAQDSAGKKAMWFDFTNPEVRRFQRDLMISAVKGYPNLDGIHFDYIRFPGSHLGYGPAAVKAYRKATGLDLPNWDKFPLKLALSANPVHAATTAKVLAKFDTGMPAILENQLGKGRALLFNWHAQRHQLRALDALLAAKLREFGAESRPVRLLTSEANTKVYGGGYREAVADWIERTGFKASDAELGKSDPSSGEILVVPNVYIWSDEDAARLRKLVEEGMNVVWIDGPAKDLPDLMAVLGADRSDAFFVGMHTITPVVKDPALPLAGDSESIHELERQAGAWVQWRMDSISDLVRDVYKSAKRARPEVEVTAAVFYTKAASSTVLQDWQRWVREGIVDYVIPMAYVNDKALAQAFDEWEDLPNWRERVIPGLSIYTRTEGKAVPQSADYVQRQVELCNNRNAAGIVYFCCHYISPELEPVLKGAQIRSTKPEIRNNP